MRKFIITQNNLNLLLRGIAETALDFGDSPYNPLSPILLRELLNGNILTEYKED